MSQAGYSGRPLFQKLGFKPGFRVQLVDAPDHYDALLIGAEGVAFLGQDAPCPFQAVHRFLHVNDLQSSTIRADIAALAPKGMLWLSWPKKSSKLFTGLTEDNLREIVLPLGWVDTKVCAVDADWSALKFLKRKEK